MSRLDVRKTYKLYIGGKFPRSESGRYLPAKSPRGEHLDNFAHASRKDFRDAVVAARAAVDGLEQSDRLQSRPNSLSRRRNAAKPRGRARE